MNNEQTTDELLKTALTALAVIVIISFGAMRLCAWGEAPLGHNPSNEAVQAAIECRPGTQSPPRPRRMRSRMVAAPLLVSDIQPSRGPSANQPS